MLCSQCKAKKRGKRKEDDVDEMTSRCQSALQNRQVRGEWIEMKRDG